MIPYIKETRVEFEVLLDDSEWHISEIIEKTYNMKVLKIDPFKKGNLRGRHSANAPGLL